MTDEEPAIVRMGAGQDDSVRNVNLDVSWTVGPDCLGQETTTVNGDPHDRPGVRSRIPESASDHPEIRRMDTGEELPVLLSSDMSADPIEGVQGSYSKIIDGECARCGYDRLVVSRHTMGGVTEETCNACGAKQDRGAEDGYSMPQTDEERADREADTGEKLADLSTRTAYDMEPSGLGPYISLVGSRNYTRIHKDDVSLLVDALDDAGDVDIAEVVHSATTKHERIMLALSLLPDDVAARLADPE